MLNIIKFFITLILLLLIFFHVSYVGEKANMLFIDRFEGNYAVVESPDGDMIDIPRDAIPSNAKEGDVLLITIDKTSTASRIEQIEQKIKSLLK